VRAEIDEGVLDLTDEKIVNIRTIFKITNEELGSVMKGQDVKSALVDLVIERMALLATER
jgi:hypothetical protein